MLLTALKYTTHLKSRPVPPYVICPALRLHACSAFSFLSAELRSRRCAVADQSKSLLCFYCWLFRRQSTAVGKLKSVPKTFFHFHIDTHFQARYSLLNDTSYATRIGNSVVTGTNSDLVFYQATFTSLWRHIHENVGSSHAIIPNTLTLTREPRHHMRAFRSRTV